MSEHSHQDAEWETEDVEVAKPVTPVISARLNAELAERVFAEATRRGVPASAIVRDALDGYFGAADAAIAAVELSVSSGDAPVAFYSGRPGTGRTASGPNTLVIKNERGQLLIADAH